MNNPIVMDLRKRSARLRCSKNEKEQSQFKKRGR